MYANLRNLRLPKEIGVEEHDGDVRFFTGSGNTAVSRMRNASGHNYWTSSFIMDVAMGQIPRSTERISSYVLKRAHLLSDFYIIQILTGAEVNTEKLCPEAV